jgi:hypothetical protein
MSKQFGTSSELLQISKLYRDFRKERESIFICA